MDRNWYSASSRLSAISSARVKAGLISGSITPLAYIRDVPSVAACDRFALAALVEPLERVGASRFEQPEPRSGSAQIRGDQRFRNKIGQAVYGIHACVCSFHSHGRGGIDRKAATEDPESPKKQLLVVAQQTVAPI